MKIRMLTVAVLYIFSQIIYSQDKSYLPYHRMINEAERAFYIHNDTGKAIRLYDSTFSMYEYIFVKDLINAAQICIFTGHENYRKYIAQAFKYGFDFEHFKYFSLFNRIGQPLMNDTSFVRVANTNRQLYREAIRHELLLKMYDFGIEDQINKNLPDKEKAQYRKRSVFVMKNLIQKFGFPSSKLIGIDDDSVFFDIGQPHLDFRNRKKKYGEQLDHFNLDEMSLSSKMVMLIMIHNQCAFFELENELYQAVLRGEIHPREVGCIYDNMYREVNSHYYKCEIPDVNNGLFLLNQFCDYKRYKIDYTKVDQLRAEWFIVALDVDEKKKEYEAKHGFTLFHGFWSCM